MKGHKKLITAGNAYSVNLILLRLVVQKVLFLIRFFLLTMIRELSIILIGIKKSLLNTNQRPPMQPGSIILSKLVSKSKPQTNGVYHLPAEFLNGHCPAGNLVSKISMTTTTSSFTSSTEKLTASKKIGNGKATVLESEQECGTFHENRNFTRSFSLSSTCSSSEAAVKFVSTDRRFSLDDALDENEEEVKPERTSSLDRLLDEERKGWTGYNHHLQREVKQQEVKSSTMGKTSTSEARRLFMQKKYQEGMSSSTSCLSKMTFSKGSSTSKTSHSAQNLKSDFTEFLEKNMPPTSGKKYPRPPPVPKRPFDRLEEDLHLLESEEQTPEVEAALSRIVSKMDDLVVTLKSSNTRFEILEILNDMNDLIRKSWAVSTRGYDLGSSLCNSLRNKGGLDALMRNFNIEDEDVQFQSARLLEQCLSTENRAYVARHGLAKVVQVACRCGTSCSPEEARIGTGILEHLFKDCEATCQEIIRQGGLKAILYDCRTSDNETLRHCAAALANLSLYGGPENQHEMIQNKVPEWLFPLAFHDDDNIKYYACLAIASLVANKEIEAAVLQSGTLDLVEPFVTSHDPDEFAKSNVDYFHGQSKSWLARLVPVLDSNNEDAKRLAAFHFALEAGIKKRQGNTALFHEIEAVCILKKVASSPNAIASRFATRALRLIGEVVPHKLSEQVPLWNVKDVVEWIKQVNFCEYAQKFQNSQVDGDLLLKITEKNLKEDIEMVNGILRQRFLRELSQLKKRADYSSCGSSSIENFLKNLGPDYYQYMYAMSQYGINKDNISLVTEDILKDGCAINNTMHRQTILRAISGLPRNDATNETGGRMAPKELDAFISYRRSNGSSVASLIRVHLQIHNFTVFLDVEKLEAGKFDRHLLNSIRKAKHFILVLTPNALDRCMGDVHCKDWVHKEIAEALKCGCIIIPVVVGQFQWPDPESLPEDIRAVTSFNAVTWSHDYQEACIEKLARFLGSETNFRSDIAPYRLKDPKLPIKHTSTPPPPLPPSLQSEEERQ